MVASILSQTKKTLLLLASKIFSLSKRIFPEKRLMWRLSIFIFLPVYSSLRDSIRYFTIDDRKNRETMTNASRDPRTINNSLLNFFEIFKFILMNVEQLVSAKIITTIHSNCNQASSPIHTAPPMLLLVAPVTDAKTLFSSRQRSTPINAIINASLKSITSFSGIIIEI